VALNIVWGVDQMALFLESPEYVNPSSTVYREVIGTSGRDALDGYDYTYDFLYGLAGPDVLNGESEDDFLVPGTGEDILNGGEDTDWLVLDDSVGPVTVDLAAFQAREASGDSDTVFGIENVAGSPEGDEISGDDADNWLVGMDGDDVLIGGGGNDHFDGEQGSDTLDGGAGNDLLNGDGLLHISSGTDTASYVSASDGVEVSLLREYQWQNTVGAGTDKLMNIENLTGSAFQDVLTGDGGANVLDGGAASDTLDGKGGSDTASYERTNGPVTVDLANRTSSGTSGTDTLLSIENVVGSAYDDTLLGDHLANVLDGGSGSDTASWLSASGPVTVNLVTGRSGGAGGADTLRSIERVVGSDGYADTLIGNAYSNGLEGRGGNDWLEGGAGADTLDGGEGEDRASWAGSIAAVTVDLVAGTARGEQDQDTLISIERVTGSGHDDSLLGGVGANTLDGSGGNDVLDGRAGRDTLDGSTGTDTVRYLQAGAAVTVDLDLGTGQTGAGRGAEVDTLSLIENAVGSALYGDTLSGDEFANVLEGRGGDDVLRGRGGDDMLDGGSGIDRVTYDDASGAVTVHLALGMTLAAPAGSDDLVAIENVTGSDFDDTLVGDASANRIEGGDGDDNIYGREGDDVLDGGEGVDTANYWDAPAFVYVDLGKGDADFGGGHDTLAGFENLIGSFWGDQLIGDAAVNEINGFQGVDTIVGQGGADVLTGGSDADIFWYGDVLDADDDFAVLEEITDFTSGSDVINLSAIDTDPGAAGDQAFTFIGTDAFSPTAVAEVRFSGGVIYVDNDNDAGAEMAIALTGVASVVAGDLVL
jgi:Ca2+-binding RTX toxin-like protein